MDHFKNKYLYSFLQGLSLVYLRFIDDLFFVWAGINEQLTNCWNNLSKKQNSIKFEYNISQTNLTFLDTEDSIQNNKLVTKLYRKSKRICITPNDFNKYCEELKKRDLSNKVHKVLFVVNKVLFFKK